MSDTSKEVGMKFFQWWDKVLEKAPLTRVGKRMTEAGFEISHTGGGCLAWEKIIDGYTVWVTDVGGIELGRRANQTYLLGIYDNDGYEVASVEAKNLQGIIFFAAEAKADIQKFIKLHPYNNG